VENKGEMHIYKGNDFNQWPSERLKVISGTAWGRVNPSAKFAPAILSARSSSNDLSMNLRLPHSDWSRLFTMANKIGIQPETIIQRLILQGMGEFENDNGITELEDEKSSADASTEQ
jgi:hypothetical protein